MSHSADNNESNGHNLVARKIPFEFGYDVDPVWNPGKPEWSHMVNGASLTMPYLEPFLIRTVREAQREVTDPALLEDLRGFMAQEGQHYQNHRRYNEMLKEKGYPELAEIEDQMEADYKRLWSKPLKWRVAYATGFETMATSVTQWLIKDRRKLFHGANPAVTSLILWHMVEETEHKTVAFDLYQSLYGDYRARIAGIFHGSWHVVKYTRKAYIMMLKKDGRWYDWHSRWRTFRTGWGFLFNVGLVVARAAIPGHHPDDVTDPEWVRQWMDAYAGLPGDQIPLLDTDDPDIGAQFS